MHTKFDLITIKCITPERVLDWAERELPTGERVGQITKPETIHYKTLKPQIGGLFCQQVFGSVKPRSCYCKKGPLLVQASKKKNANKPFQKKTQPISFDLPVVPSAHSLIF